MFSYWFLHVFFPIWGRIPVYKRVRTNVIPLVCMAIWLLYIYIYIFTEGDIIYIYILYGSYMSYRDLQCLGCTSKSHNIIMFSPTVRFPSSQEFSAFSSHVFPSSWWAIQVFNFVFELRPKVGQALPVIKRVFPNAEAVAARVASRTSGIDAMKTWGWWIFISGFPMEHLEKCGIPNSSQSICVCATANSELHLALSLMDYDEVIYGMSSFPLTFIFFKMVFQCHVNMIQNGVLLPSGKLT